MKKDDRMRDPNLQDPDLAETEPIESIEDLLKKCGFFDGILPKESDEEALAS